MHLLADALPEFLGSVAATLLVALIRWTVSTLRARAGRAARSRCGRDEPDREAA